MAHDVDRTADALHDGDVERAASQIVDEELTVLQRRVAPLTIGDRRHRGCDRFLDQADAADAGGLRRTHGGFALHLIEGRRDRDDRALQIELTCRELGLRQKRLEHFGARLLGAHRPVGAPEFDRARGAHEAFELLADVLGREGVLLVGSFSDEHAAAAVDHDRARQHVRSVHRLVEAQFPTVVADDGRIGRSQIDAEVHAHSLLVR
ncbi:hypothetical protein ABIA44_004335 [Bradyrhizobium sp. USDA 329]